MNFLGDNIIQKSISEFTKSFQNSKNDPMILLCKVDNPSRFGIAEVKNGRINKIMEKPKNPPSNLAVTGIYLLTPIIFDIIDRLKPSERNEFEITDALQMLLDETQNISYNMITDYWKDTGTPEDIIHANAQVLEKIKPFFGGEKEDGVLVEGTLIVGKGTILKSGSKIKGPVIIGENCVIESKTSVGPNTSVGDNSFLSGCDIENSIIMSDCKIECDVKIRQSIISTNSHINQNKRNNKEQVFLLGEGTKITL